MAGFQGDAEGGGDGFVDLVPSEGFVGGDVEGFAEGAGVADQADVAAGEVFIPGHGP